MQKGNLRDKIKSFGRSVTQTVRGQDQFGSNISLNFKGEDQLKTLPGGFISLFVSLCLISYLFLKLKLMVNAEEWVLQQQRVLSSTEEL